MTDVKQTDPVFDSRAAATVAPTAPMPAATGYRICTRCVMDTTDPKIRFDDEGVCNYCRGYFERLKRRLFTGRRARSALDRALNHIKAEGRGKPYDCVIGVSGGVDSTMVAYHVKRLGLRPLAVHLDNGWNSELAVDNITRTLETLGIDLHTHVLNWPDFRDLQLSFLKASVFNCEIPTDHAITALLYRMASKLGVRYVVTGSNIATEGIHPAWGYHNQDYRHIHAIHRRFGTRSLRDYPKLRLWDWVRYTFVKGIKYWPILNYLDYDKEDSMRILTEEIGWRPYGAKHYESIYTRFFQGYYLPRKFGIDKRRGHLSTMVCSGMIGRDEALAELDTPTYDPRQQEEDRLYVIKKFGLNEAEFEAILNAPPRLHEDYPSNRKLYEKFGAVVKVAKRRATSFA